MAFNLPQTWVSWLKALAACVFGFVAAGLSYGLATRQWNTNTLWAGGAAAIPPLVTLLLRNPFAADLSAITTLTLSTSSLGAMASMQTSSGPAPAPAEQTVVVPVTQPPAPAFTPKTPGW